MKQTYILKSFVFLFSVSLGIGVVSCKKPTEPDNTPGFSISVEDVSCIEAWVRVKSEGLKLPAEIIITKNDTSFALLLNNKNIEAF